MYGFKICLKFSGFRVYFKIFQFLNKKNGFQNEKPFGNTFLVIPRV